MFLAIFFVFWVIVVVEVIYEAIFCFDVVQGRRNGAPIETGSLA